MKKAALVLLAVVLLAAPAWAGQIRTLSNLGSYTSGTGGEFTLWNVDGFDPAHYSELASQGQSFQTFCIEATGAEYIYPNTLYNAELNSNAVYGGTGSATGDPVSVGTGWLYSQFATGTLAEYQYGVGRTASAGLLQATIWWLEGEGAEPGGTNPFRDAVEAEFANPFEDGGWDYGVYAINLWVGADKNAGRRQDQLFYIPDGGTTMLLLGGALVALGALRRRFAA